MLVTKKLSSQNSFDVNIRDANLSLTIMFGGTLDLYWILKKDNEDNEENEENEVNEINHLSFLITKENYSLYNSFDNLFQRIDSIDLYDEITYPRHIDSMKDLEEYLLEEKEKYKKYNKGNYLKLYNKDKKTITWYSDETAYEVSNYVVITKDISSFKLDFYTQPYIDGYEREQNRFGTIAIRFRNSGSRYEPFNAIFMRMYNELQNIDDTLSDGHQIHIEEYLFTEKKRS